MMSALTSLKISKGSKIPNSKIIHNMNPPRPSTRIRGWVGVALLVLGSLFLPPALAADAPWTQPVVRVSVETQPLGVPGFNPAWVDTVFRALDTWVQAAGDPLRIQAVADPRQAQIHVRWVRSFNMRELPETQSMTQPITLTGITEPLIADGTLEEVTTTLATQDSQGQPLTPEALYPAALHEMGHALGLLEHSDQAQDVMANRTRPQTQLSLNDVARIRGLYGRVAALAGTGPASLAVSGELLPSQQAPLEASPLLSDLPLDAPLGKTALDYQNEAAQAFNEGQYPLALAAIQEALRLAPLSAQAYYQRALIQEGLQNFPASLADIEQAIRLDSSPARYFLEKAWVLAQLTRRDEARQALDAYQFRAGPETDRQAVIRLQAMLGTVP